MDINQMFIAMQKAYYGAFVYGFEEKFNFSYKMHPITFKKLIEEARKVSNLKFETNLDFKFMGIKIEQDPSMPDNIFILSGLPKIENCETGNI
jgi:hypothetical protein